MAMSTSHERDQTPDEAWSQWTGLIARSMEAQARLARDANDVLRRAGAQTQIPASLLDRDQLEAWGREGLTYWNDLVTLGIGYANNVISVTQNAAGRFLQDVDAVARPSAAHVAPTRVPVELAAAEGDAITTHVTVSNNRGATRRVEFEVGRFSGPSGPFHPHVTFDPAHSILGPGEERQVSLRIQIDPKDATAGDVCHGEVRILGGDDVVLVLTIRVSSPS
jgi:hypothetical protein